MVLLRIRISPVKANVLKPFTYSKLIKTNIALNLILSLKVTGQQLRVSLITFYPCMAEDDNHRVIAVLDSNIPYGAAMR